jgi:teichuronic acid biosynthesis glycosyltransferase TuaG
MFSIIVPTFNSGKTICQTMSSILAQSYVRFEVLVIDNYSSDNTKLLVDSFCDKRVSFHLVENQGMPAISRNYGISLAKFDYIAFCDSDDTWMNNKLLTCMDHIEKGSDFIAHDLELSGSLLKSFFKTSFSRRRPKTFEEFIDFGNPIAQSSVVIRREILLQVGMYDTDPKLIAIEDCHLWAKVLRSGVELSYIDKKLGTYLYSPLALSSSANQFKASRAFRLDFSVEYKPCWYKYNIATYLLRQRMYRRSSKYLKSLWLDRQCPIELRLKSLFLWMKICVR